MRSKMIRSDPGMPSTAATSSPLMFHCSMSTVMALVKPSAPSAEVLDEVGLQAEHIRSARGLRFGVVGVLVRDPQPSVVAGEGGVAAGFRDGPIGEGVADVEDLEARLQITKQRQAVIVADRQ